MKRYLLLLAGLLLVVVALQPGPEPAISAQEARLWQVWPDRVADAASGRLEFEAEPPDGQPFAFGVARGEEGETVRGRTYMDFELDTFPPGTDVLRAMLYVYVDSASSRDEGRFGAYRVVEPWEEAALGGEPATWVEILSSPVAVTTARFQAAEAQAGKPALLSWRFQSPLPTSPVATGTPEPTSTSTPEASATPTVTSTSGPSPTPTSTAEPTTAEPTPTPTPTSAITAVVSMDEVPGREVVWDVTALVRAWISDEVPNYGVALAPAPEPSSGPGTAGDLMLARWHTADEADTRPYLIVNAVVRPVTPTPTQVPILPGSGDEGLGPQRLGFTLAGIALVVWGGLLCLWIRRSSTEGR